MPHGVINPDDGGQLVLWVVLGLACLTFVAFSLFWAYANVVDFMEQRHRARR